METSETHCIIRDQSDSPPPTSLAAEQVSLEIEYHAGDYGDHLEDYSFWFWFWIISILVFLLAYWVLSYVGASLWLTMPMLAGLALLPNILPYVESRLRGRGSRHAFAARPQARLRAMGRQDELATLQNLPDVPFEPVIIYLRSTVNWWQAVIFGSIIGLLLSNGSPFPSFRHFYGAICGGVSIGGIFMALSWLSVKHLRLVPGRLDVLHVSPLNRRISIQSRYDLRTATVTVSFSTGQIEIAPTKDSSFKILLHSLSEPRRFVQGLFQAAVCTHPAPPLPDDALLG